MCYIYHVRRNAMAFDKNIHSVVADKKFLESHLLVNVNVTIVLIVLKG